MKRKLITAILAVAMLTLLLALLASCSPRELEAPEVIKYDGERLTWNAIDGAEGYSVKINDGEAYTVKVPIYLYNAMDGEFTVTITAKPKEGTAAKSVTKTFRPLGKVEALTFDADGNVTWDAVANATSYRVRLNGIEVPTAYPLARYNDLPVGIHSVQVKPVIDGDDSYYAPWSPVYEAQRLATVETDQITYSGGYIKWRAIEDAFCYEIKVNGETLSSDCTATSIAYDAENENFSVTVKPIGNAAAKIYNGAVSETKDFVFLDTISEIRVQDGVLFWDAIAGATGYKIKLNGVEKAETLTDCRFDGLAAGDATAVEVMPISENTAYFSDWSASKNILVLPKPELQWNNFENDGIVTNNIVWNGIANSSGYTVRVTFPDGTSTDIVCGETERSYANAYLEVGTYLIAVKATASAATMDGSVYDSAFSTPIKVVRLAAPKATDKNHIVSNPNNVSEGFTVNFERVAGAVEYKLYADANLLGSTTENQFRVGNVVDRGVTEEQTHNYMIQSVGSVKNVNGQIVATLSSLLDSSLTFSVTVLPMPSSPTLSGTVYSYGEITKAYGYTVDVAGKSYMANGTSYDLALLEAGTYAVSVCATGNGSNILASNYTAPINVCRLEAPTNVRIDTSDAAEGVLTYTGVAHAKGYYIVFNNDGNAIPVDNMMNLNSRITEQGTTVYMQSSADYFNDDRTVYYMSSKPGDTVTFIKLAAPTFGDVAFSNTQLIWNRPANVDSAVFTPVYEVYYPNGTLYNGLKNGTTMDISYLDGGEYTFQIKAIGDGVTYINSEKSTTVTIRKLATPTVTRENGSYVFGAVSGGTVGYSVYVDGVLADTITHVVGTPTYTFTPLFRELKTYTVEIVAVGDGLQTINSKPATIEQKTKQLITPNFTISYSKDAYAADGEVIVTVTETSPYARGYSYRIGGNTQTSTEASFSMVPNSVGKIIVSVFALGGTFDEEGNYYIDSQARGGTDNYAITLLTAPNYDSFRLTAEGHLSWASIASAEGYEILISVNGGEETSYFTTASSFDVPSYASVTTMTVKVRAKGADFAGTVTSEWVERTWTNLH